MTMALQTSYLHMQPSPAMEERIRALAARLEHFSPHITHCHVTVQAPTAHHHQRHVFEVGIDVGVPDRKIRVRHTHLHSHAHEDPYLALRDAFRAARRQLQDYERERRGT